MMPVGWRGKGKAKATPEWRLAARRAKTISANTGYSLGGLPRSRPREAPSLATLKFMEKPEPK